MNTVIYPAVVTGDDTSGYRASFPDLADVEASAPNLAELLLKAREKAADHLKTLANDGREWPPARPLAGVAHAPGAAVILVDVQMEDAPVRVNISIGEQLLKRLDAAAETRGTTRSGFIAAAVRASLGDKPRGAQTDFEAAARQMRDELSAFGKRLGDRLGPDSAFSRSMADLDDKVLEAVRKAADNVSSAIARRRQEATARRTVHGADETVQH